MHDKKKHINNLFIYFFAELSSELDVIDQNDASGETSGDDDENDDDDDDIMALRNQAAKRRRTQKSYEYMVPTSEWSEKEYYGEASAVTKVNQFWIDYLENSLDIFVSGVCVFMKKKRYWLKTDYLLSLLKLLFIL
jgi:hypothetical protein